MHVHTVYTSARRQVSALLYDQSVTERWMVDMFVHSLHGTYQLGMHHLRFWQHYLVSLQHMGGH